MGVKFKEGNPGKPKGAVNKVNKLVKDVVADVFEALQTDPKAKQCKADLKSWAMENPKDFYQIAAKLIPVQMQHSGDKENPIQLLFKQSKDCESLNDDNQGS